VNQISFLLYKSGILYNKRPKGSKTHPKGKLEGNGSVSCKFIERESAMRIRLGYLDCQNEHIAGQFKFDRYGKRSNGVSDQ